MRSNSDFDICMQIKYGDYIQQKKEYEAKFPTSYFPGKYPVRILKHNIEKRLANLSVETKKLLNTKIDWISNALNYILDDDGISSPRCSFNNKFEISFSENFFTYIWSTSYYLLLLTEKKVQFKHSILLGSEYIISDQMIENAHNLLRWVLQRKNGKTDDWPDYYPSPMPTSKLIDSECIYSLYTNHISINAICFILYHEFCHAYYCDNFCSSLSQIEKEKRADNFAINLCLNPTEELPSRESIIFSILIGFNSLFFSYDNLNSSYADIDHPPLTSRIKNVIDTFEIENKISRESIQNIKTIQTIFLKFFCNYFNVKYTNTEIRLENIDDTLEDFISLLSQEDNCPNQILLP